MANKSVILSDIENGVVSYDYVVHGGIAQMDETKFDELLDKVKKANDVLIKFEKQEMELHNALLELKNYRKEYGDLVVFEDVDIKKGRPSKLNDEQKSILRACLYKKTAKWVYLLLKNKYGYQGSYRVIAETMKKIKDIAEEQKKQSFANFAWELKLSDPFASGNFPPLAKYVARVGYHTGNMTFDDVADEVSASFKVDRNLVLSYLDFYQKGIEM